MSADRRINRLEVAAIISGEERLLAIFNQLTDDELVDFFDGWEAQLQGTMPTSASIAAHERFCALGGMRYWAMALGVSEAAFAQPVTPALEARIAALSKRIWDVIRWRHDTARRRREREEVPQ